jgi:hypothetical protein
MSAKLLPIGITIKIYILNNNHSIAIFLMDASKLSASQAREKIIEWGEGIDFETVCREIVCRMSGDEAREFVEYFHDNVLNN